MHWIIANLESNFSDREHSIEIPFVRDRCHVSIIGYQSTCNNARKIDIDVRVIRLLSMTMKRNENKRVLETSPSVNF